MAWEQLLHTVLQYSGFSCLCSLFFQLVQWSNHMWWKVVQLRNFFLSLQRTTPLVDPQTNRWAEQDCLSPNVIEHSEFETTSCFVEFTIYWKTGRKFKMREKENVTEIIGNGIKRNLDAKEEKRKEGKKEKSKEKERRKLLTGINIMKPALRSFKPFGGWPVLNT